MARIWAVLALTLLATACASRSTGSPDPQPTTGPAIDSTIVAFDPGGSARGNYAALSTDPIDFRAFSGWWAGANPEDEAPVQKPGTDTTYVAATAMTGCRSPETVEVHLSGTDLRVDFVGGTDHPECVRAVGPTVVLALRTSQVRAVTTVNGKRPLDPAGPGTLTHFVKLGTADLSDVQPAELGNTTAMAARLADNPEATSALTDPVPQGRRGYAFIRGGCAETSAVLLINHSTMTATLTGGEQTRCDQQEYFLTTFTIPDDKVPPAATPR